MAEIYEPIHSIKDVQFPFIIVFADKDVDDLIQDCKTIPKWHVNNRIVEYLEGILGFTHNIKLGIRVAGSFSSIQSFNHGDEMCYAASKFSKYHRYVFEPEHMIFLESDFDALMESE